MIHIFETVGMIVVSIIVTALFYYGVGAMIGYRAEKRQ